MIVATYDIGTHSTRLLIAEIKDNKVKELERKTTITRLGEGIANKIIQNSAIERTATVLREYKSLAGKYEIERSVVVATSAVRDAQNAAEFTNRIQKVLSLELLIISGDREAHLTFLGVCTELSKLELNKNILVIDIGGGSTELVAGIQNKVTLVDSLNAGCLRLNEQFLKTDPPKPDEVEKLLNFLDNEFGSRVDEFKNGFEMAIAVAGTSSSLASIKHRLKEYDRLKINRTELTISDIENLNKQLYLLPLKQRKEVVGLEPNRADVIVAGGLILEYLMKKLDIKNIMVFESDILDGLAVSISE